MKPERRYRESIHRLLPDTIYAQGMGGTMTGGTPDAYYEGGNGILWVEWKWTSALSPRLIPELTPLQQRWLTRAHSNGVRVAVICGSPILGYVFPGLTWKVRRTKDAVISGTKKEVAEWLSTSLQQKAR